MPPKAKITREMIVDTGFKIVQECGIENVNARTIAQRLSCSTQPVLYYFNKIEDIKKAVYKKADVFHSLYITDIHSEYPMQEMGLLYIRFAQTEKHLFRFLFQSNEFSGKSISELINAEEIAHITAMLSDAANISIEQAKTVFKSLFLFVHGYASMFANNSMEYDEKSIESDLERIFIGAIYTSKEGLQ